MSTCTDGSSAGILLYGWAIFQKRLTLISTRNPDGFGKLPAVLEGSNTHARPHLGPNVHLRRLIYCHPRQLHLPSATGKRAHGNQPHVDHQCLGSRQAQGIQLLIEGNDLLALEPIIIALII